MAIVAGTAIPTPTATFSTSANAVRGYVAATLENLAKTGVVATYANADFFNYYNNLGFVEVETPSTWGIQFNTSEVSHDGAELYITNDFAAPKQTKPSLGRTGYITPGEHQNGVTFSHADMVRNAKQGEEFFRYYVERTYVLGAHMLVKKFQQYFRTELLNKAFEASIADGGTNKYVWADGKPLISASHAYVNGVTYDNHINLPVATEANVIAALDALRARIADIKGSDGYEMGGEITDVIVRKGTALESILFKLAQVSNTAAFSQGIVTVKSGATATYPTVTSEINIYPGAFRVISVTGFNASELLAFNANTMNKPVKVLLAESINALEPIGDRNGSLSTTWKMMAEIGIVNEPNTLFGIKEII